jgi:hypothetical protein
VERYTVGKQKYLSLENNLTKCHCVYHEFRLDCSGLTPGSLRSVTDDTLPELRHGPDYDFSMDVLSSVPHNVAQVQPHSGCFATVFQVITPDKFACSFFMLRGNVSVQRRMLSCS